MNPKYTGACPGAVYSEDADGNPIYDWSIVDAIFDAYLARGVRPYVQIGFMPEALSRKPQPYQHSWTPYAKYDEIYTGWAYPPTDWQKWGDLCYEWARHSVERWGRSEVETWYWQVWNEANIGYWRGTPEEFRTLHDWAVAGVRRALPTAKIGGCDAAGGGGQFFRDFLNHALYETNAATGQTDPPLDFVSFHSKGNPRFIDADETTRGHVRMGIANQLRTIDETFALIASYPELKTTPIVIGESDPDGCAACQGPQLGYRNGTMYSSYTVASFARKHELAHKHGVHLEGALTWAFEFEDTPLFAGFRVLATRGALALPVLNAFHLMSQMHGDCVHAESDAMVPLQNIVASGVRGETPDVGVQASLSAAGDKLFVLLWHYHDDDLPGPTADVSLALQNLPAPLAAKGAVSVTAFRVDDTHGNAYTAWRKMGSPPEPTPEQAANLEVASALAPADDVAASAEIADDKTAHLSLSLPRQGVVLLVVA